ncbi:MAG: DUF4363 family protein [Clostridia bacterium]|nr:DUF4363 family protein [Clostridia bacterium]
MKRIYISIVLLLAIIGTCIGAVIFLSYQTETLIREMDKLSDDFDPEDPKAFLPQTEEVIEHFRERTILFPLFIRQNTLMEIEAELEILPALLEKGEPKDFVASLSRCQTRLETQLRLEMPLLQNIF